MSQHKVPFLKSFFRAQIASICATSVDFLSLLGLEETNAIQNVSGSTAETSLLISTGIASSLGAIVGFLMGRHWVFKRTDRKFWIQAFKYFLASVVIALVNIIGMHYLSNVNDIQYLISKLLVAAVAGVFVSFPLFRYWVYN